MQGKIMWSVVAAVFLATMTGLINYVAMIYDIYATQRAVQQQILMLHQRDEIITQDIRQESREAEEDLKDHLDRGHK